MGKNKQRKKRHIPLRLNVLFFAVFILFSALILRLGIVQIVQGEEFVRDLERTSNTTARIDAPRGLMYDAYNHVIVDNELELSVTYTNPSQQTKPEEILKIAEKLEKLIDVDTSQITERDKKDFWLIKQPTEVKYELVSKKERSDLEPSEEYQLELNRITEEHLAQLSDQDLRVLAIFREMSRGYANVPQRIKRGITDEEAHILSEYLDQLPGVDILRDSRRSYVYGNSLRSIFGSTGSIPRERLNYYLSRGYDRSDIVGTSFLEYQYEDVLRGQKAIVESITTSTGGKSIERSINEQLGQRGNDLVLTVDMELQQKVEAAIEEEMKKSPNAFIKDRQAYAIMMDPRTGDILAMVGYWDPADRERSQYDDHIGNINKAFEMGSSVKAASVLTGFQTGVTSPYTRFHDRPIKLPGTQEKKSVRNFGWIDDKRALEVSSNVYMFEIAMKMANYNSKSQCCWNSATIEKAYNDARYYFSQFGLGSETGIDLPSASSGLSGGIQRAGNLLDLFIGQFDTYTPLQLAQYISTVANDGYRMQPRLVKEIREPTINKEKPGAVIQRFEPTVLNRIDMSDTYINRVQEGLRGVMTNGTASGTFANAPYQPAGKTGTAQVKVAVGEGDNRRLVDGNTQTLIGYAPYNNPEVSFVVVVPYAKRDSASGANGSFSRNVSKAMLDAYFDLKEQRNGPISEDQPILEDITE
ncbi:peptidoglycan D,D-transpeptidase FtsI family protein [Halalkalibacter urbisdiaboli]|uniref:peptidoglycan D,D-transpeptidase FtsI family protein n=1 Tax=Halalkalibacter urbisdiaboli TaxID=1960589 RepID=UPI000B43E629|nr:penicillin-binding protein 2 [Halalkalibacter urbisdiaboli]